MNNVTIRLNRFHRWWSLHTTEIIPIITKILRIERITIFSMHVFNVLVRITNSNVTTSHITFQSNFFSVIFVNFAPIFSRLFARIVMISSTKLIVKDHVNVNCTLAWYLYYSNVIHVKLRAKLQKRFTHASMLAIDQSLNHATSAHASLKFAS